MSEFSKEELLDCFDNMCLFLAIHGWVKKDKRVVEIRELIKNQKEKKMSKKCQICNKDSKDWALWVTMLSGKEIRICVNCGAEILDFIGMLFEKESK